MSMLPQGHGLTAAQRRARAMPLALARGSSVRAGRDAPTHPVYPCAQQRRVTHAAPRDPHAEVMLEALAPLLPVPAFCSISTHACERKRFESMGQSMPYPAYPARLQGAAGQANRGQRRVSVCVP